MRSALLSILVLLVASCGNQEVIASAIVSSPLARTGFRQFSQRATRLQFLQKTIKGRGSILGDVFTNKQSSGGKKKKRKREIQFDTDDDNIIREGDSNEYYGPIGGGARMYLPERLQHYHDSQAISFLRQCQKSLSFLVPALGIVEEAVGGYVAGYICGAVTILSKISYRGIRDIFSSTSQAAATTSRTVTASANDLLPYPVLTKYSQDLLQSHARCIQWAVEWGKISAVFGTCRLVCHVLREHPPSSWKDTYYRATFSTKEDESFYNYHHDEPYRDTDAWDSVSGSALAGAVLAGASTFQTRTETNLYVRWTWIPGPAVRSALLYGGVMLLLHPQLWKPCFEALQLVPPKSKATTDTSMQTFLGRNGFFVVPEHRPGPWYDRIGLLE